MNIILFLPHEVQLPLPRSDDRSRHILEVLKCAPGDSFDAGIVNGARGRGTLESIASDRLTLSFAWRGEVEAPAPIHLIVGLPRPQTARDLLRECASLGVRSIDFVYTDRGEPSYGQSSLWKTNAWKNQLMAGAGQAFGTRIPEVRHGIPLEQAVLETATSDTRLVLDNYEGASRLGSWTPAPTGIVTLAVGAERGWSPTERSLFRASGFTFHHLGDRVLRVETATIAAVSLIKGRLGLA